MKEYRVKSRARLTDFDDSVHPVGGYFGMPLREWTTNKAHADAVADDVRRALGEGFHVWIEERGG